MTQAADNPDDGLNAEDEGPSTDAPRLDSQMGEQTEAGDVPPEDAPHEFAFRRAANKVREFPQTPGVYLMKDAAGRVIYIGKATNLRSRAGSYFLKAARYEFRTRDWVHEIADADYVECESEVDALLMESRLIKDIQPPHNRELKDDKTFPYLMITTHEDFPRVEVTREPRDRGVKLYGPFPSAGSLRGALQVMQRIFKFRPVRWTLKTAMEKWQWFRPCLLASIDQCTAPCNLRISKEEYRKDIRRLQMFMEGKKSRLLKQLKDEMLEASKNLEYEQAAALRDEIHLIETLDKRGELDEHAQPRGVLRRSQERARWAPADFEAKRNAAYDRRHRYCAPRGRPNGRERGELYRWLAVQAGYRRYKIREVKGIDDFGSIREVVARRYRRMVDEGDKLPDIVLIDGGRGQLNSALNAFEQTHVDPPTVISLAKREEEVCVPNLAEPLRISPPRFCTPVAAIRARRSASFRATLPQDPAPKIDVRRTEIARVTLARRCLTMFSLHSPDRTDKHEITGCRLLRRSHFRAEYCARSGQAEHCADHFG